MYEEPDRNTTKNGPTAEPVASVSSWRPLQRPLAASCLNVVWYGWAQAALRAALRVWLTGRLTWSDDLRAGADDDQAYGIFASASAAVGRWLSLRASVLARLGGQGPALADPGAGVVALVGVGSRL